MNIFEKESVFWYGLHLIAVDEPHLKYQITTQKELISRLYPLVFCGVIQYKLYRGIKIEEIPLEETNDYVNYIIENMDDIYRVKYRFVSNKPKKIQLKDEEEIELIQDIISGLLIPYINKYCFHKLDTIANMSEAFIGESIINYEYDINHKSDDGKLKTSMLYPFLFTLNLIKVFDKQGLYHRVLKYYQKDDLVRKYKNGREWKQKEIEYLQETIELLENDEEWSMFLSNFSVSKWDLFDIKERFKALLQLTKVTTILMKDEITAVTMLSDGEEIFEMLENNLPLYIDIDRYIDENGKQIKPFDKCNKSILAPFALKNINRFILKPYIESKGERHCVVESQKIDDYCQIVLKATTKIKTLLLTHEYLPKVIDSVINVKKKMFCEILELFVEIKDGKFKRNLDFKNFSEETLFITEEEYLEIVNYEFKELEDFLVKPAFKKIGRAMTVCLALEPKTARISNYSLKELLMYLLVIFGPHPLDHTIQTQESVDNIHAKLVKFCKLYEEVKEKTTKKEFANELQVYLELPLKLLNW
ncbi:hypothetical protein SCHIN_v1c04630 [Spiroplasma chinense]|uniref:Uncharacterized protein n=1 Tax=Spiroplasma chinense TaxID=216932 RepID=A0A5B9Y3Y0_9MOLU|nr:hypothetical protein [Spiroplasma chinense]QEH61660.1 hypothetical protein SCHIN_v1c04630 [Spiroplasma chinense]